VRNDTLYGCTCGAVLPRVGDEHSSGVGELEVQQGYWFGEVSRAAPPAGEWRYPPPYPSYYLLLHTSLLSRYYSHHFRHHYVCMYLFLNLSHNI
jgi:hypothetical protein